MSKQKYYSRIANELKAKKSVDLLLPINFFLKQ